MGSPTILYCGNDDCLRVPVLQAAGFRVARCASVTELERRLGEVPGPAAVIFAEGRGDPADAAARLTRQSSRAALVLFRHPAGDSREEHFDLVIDPVTPPMRWLRQLAEIVLARAGFDEATPGWGQIARDLQARRGDVPGENGSSGGAYGIQPPKRRCT